ncbi:MAG: alkaline phosphatase PhoX [Candidatus Kapaibacterium sp.]
MKKSLLVGLLSVSLISQAAGAEFPTKVQPKSMIPYLTHSIVVPPSPLKYQVLFIGGVHDVQTTPTYGKPAGATKAKQWHDFIGFTKADATKGETGLGWISVNHEMVQANDNIGDGGGMTVFKVAKSGDSIIVVDQSLSDVLTGKYFNVDFVNTVGETGMNCGGIQSPDGRIWTAEEWFRSANNDGTGDDIFQKGAGVRDTADFTIGTTTPNGFPQYNGTKIKKYQNFNWMVEIDPRTAKAVRKQYNWGRQGFEGGEILPDNKTVFIGEDGDAGSSLLTKFVADTPGDFTKGKTYLFKQKENSFQGDWIEVPQDLNTMMDIHTWAAKNSITGFTRIEWLAYDKKSNKLFMTETGSDAPGATIKKNIAAGFRIPKHYTDMATAAKTKVDSSNFNDYYGRVLELDVATNEVKSFLEAGPKLDDRRPFTAYPDKHLSNPDGITVLEVKNKRYLIIQEDLNGSTFGRVPFGMSNRSCEIFALDLDDEPKIENLTRLAIVPYGAEVTGARAIDNGNTLLFNSQHPSSYNQYPYNNSVTVAVSGFDKLVTGIKELDDNAQIKGIKVYPNPASRELRFDNSMDAALYNNEGSRVRVVRNANAMDISDLNAGVYFLMNNEGDTQKVIIE